MLGDEFGVSCRVDNDVDMRWTATIRDGTMTFKAITTVLICIECGPPLIAITAVRTVQPDLNPGTGKRATISRGEDGSAEKVALANPVAFRRTGAVEGAISVRTGRLTIIGAHYDGLCDCQLEKKEQ